MAKGSSGGPLLDAGGRLVGLNTSRLGEGFYAALPADDGLRRRVDALSRGESPARPRLGVGLVPGRAARHIRRAAGLPDRDGVLIQEVEEASPAAALSRTGWPDLPDLAANSRGAGSVEGHAGDGRAGRHRRP
jgi:S1-C subfamily serine protease